MSSKFRKGWLVGLMLGITGCSDPPPPPADLLPPGSITGSAVIEGRVTFQGTPPVMKPIREHCYAGQGEMTEETVLVNETGGLANVLVFIDGLPAEDGTGKPAVELDQQNCRFIPHVIGVQINQPLRITTSDPVFHNVHYVSEFNGSANFGLEKAGDRQDVTFSRPEVFSVRCDVHPWMNAWIGVFPNGLHTVTGTGGGFRLAGVPAGQHTLVFRHERLGERRQTVTISEGGKVTADVVYAP